MEFWGVEVKAGEPLKVEPGEDKILHLSQASLGEAKKEKANESIPLFVKIGGQKIVIGTLSPEKCTHISYDLVFEKEFEISHNWKNGSVYFCGYTSVIPDESDDFSDFDSDSGEELPVIVKENGKSEAKDKSKATADKANASKPDSSAAKPKVKIVEPNKDDKSKDDVDADDESDDDEDEDESDDEDMLDGGGSDDESSEDGISDEDDEATPKKAELSKKRPAGSATKTPVPEKKAKLVTPQKTGPDGKKGGGHTATPYPSKQTGKTTPATDKSKQQTPKSAAQVICKTCSKTFNSDNALQSHSKAKHSGGK